MAQFPTTFYGNEQRDQLYLPAQTFTNLSLQKEFALPKDTRLQFRAEAFNVFGNVNLIQPVTVLNQLTSPNIPFQLQNSTAQRQLQFGLRIIY